MRAIQKIDTDFNLDRHLLGFLQDVAFFAELSRQIRKIPTESIPTAGVSWDPISDEMVMYWNPKFFGTLTNWNVRSVLTHEFYHLIFGHLNARRKHPFKLWNVATDLAINSLIMTSANDSKPRDADEGEEPLPGFALIPGRFPKLPGDRELSQEEKSGSRLSTLISTFSVREASEWYFNKIVQDQNENPGLWPGDGDYIVDSMDDHSMWDDIPEEKREYVESRVKSIIEKAVNHADAQSNGWGKMPEDIRREIRASVSRQVDWRVVLRQFVGSLLRGNRTTTIKRINKRYPYVHPGVKRSYLAKLLVAIDQSGSVSDEMISEFFAELGGLTKHVDIDVIFFDSTVARELDGKVKILRWKKGTTPQPVRVKSGGTDFNAPTDVFNDPKNRKRWDGLLVATDGGAPEPKPCRGKRGWVLGTGTKLAFTSNEVQISVSDERPMSGAWR